MIDTGTGLADLERRHPEWGPWLAVVATTLREAESPGWDAMVPSLAAVDAASAPRLSGATLRVDTRAVRGLLERLTRAASRQLTPEMATLGSVLDASPDLAALFRASVCRDSEAIAGVAASCGADRDAFEAVGALLAVPFLMACNRRWSASLSPDWVQGYCQVCGAWPAFAEVRGIERTRFSRCARCGCEWPALPLRCPYCGVDDHEALVSLVPEAPGLDAVIEACQSCRGYLKAFTRLQGCPPAAVMIEDLATVQLDLAALEQGYLRPADGGHAIDVTVTES